MPRPLEQVHEEILRVAQEVGVDPRSTSFTRKVFLAEDGDFRPTFVTKHDLAHYGGFSRLKADSAHVGGVPPDANMPEARGVQLRNSYVRRLERIAGARDYYSSKLEEAITATIKANPPKLSTGKYKAKSRAKTKSAVTLVWSDLHFGVDVKEFEVLGSKFDWTIASRRMALLCLEAVAYAEKNESTECRIVLNGDIMQGVIHLDDANIKPMTEQIWRAASILIAAIDYLAQFFPKLTVVCLPGNHDRMTYKSSSRELSQRWDSHAHSLYLALFVCFQKTHVNVDIPASGIAFVDDLNDGVILASHGDTAPDPKNVSKSIAVGAMAETLLRIQESNAIDKRISVAIFGHWHTPTVQMLPSGGYLIVNGSLIGGEPFGQNGIGVFNPEPAQVMFLTTQGYPVKDVSIVQVREADEDESLDDIIPPPEFITSGKLGI